MKLLKFEPTLVAKIRSGEKFSTWRLFDDKNLQEGDEIGLLEQGTAEPFATAQITKIVEKEMGLLSEEDWIGHATYPDEATLYKTYSGYYNQEVGPQSLVKIIWFNASLVQKDSRMIDIDIVLIPSSEIAEKAIDASQSLTTLGTHYALDGKTAFPHLSLYMLRIQQTQLVTILEEVKTISRTQISFELSPEKFSSKARYVSVHYATPARLAALQKAIITALNTLRTGLPKISANLLPSAEGVAKVNLEQYGYKNLFDTTHPHLTLTRYTEEQDNPLQGLDNLIDFQGSFVGLGIYEISDIGTCIREISTYLFID